MKLFRGHRRLGVGSILLSVCAAAGCDTGPTKIQVIGSSFAPTPPFVVFVQPSLITLTPTRVASCRGLVPAGGFDLVVQRPSTSVSLTQVTIEMIDGTHLGGSPVTIPSPRSLFPSTLITAGTVGVFPFTPDFGCVTQIPTEVVISVTLTDQRGNPQKISTTAPVRQTG
jgi:hypothetical protein